MSAISGFINTIRTAVYGEQVRGAIISALEQCYSDVSNPSLQTEAFSAAVEAAYAGGFLDIQEKTTVAGMTNEKIIYRYTGNEAGYINGALYYYDGTSWKPIGSGVQSVSSASLMVDQNAIYKYIGTETGYIQNALYYYNGTLWAPVADLTPINTKLTNIIGALSCIQQMLNRAVFSGDISASNTELRRYMSALIGDEDDGINYISRISATAGALIDIGVEWEDAYYTSVNCANNGTAAYKMLFSSSNPSASGAYFGVATGATAGIMALQVGGKYKDTLNFGVLNTLAQNDSSAKNRTPTQDGTQTIIAFNSACYVYQITLENIEGELILDLRPCVDENEVVCFYDRVTQTYIYNTGSGSFTEG